MELSKHEMEILGMGPYEYAKSILGEKPLLPHIETRYDRNWYYEMYPELCYIYYTMFVGYSTSYIEQIKLLKSRGVEIPPETLKKIYFFFGKNKLEDQ